MKIEIHAVPVTKGEHRYLRIMSPVRVVNSVDGGFVYADLMALWDTGATNTCISMSVAKAMGIPLDDPSPISKMKATVQSRRCQFVMEFPVHGSSETFVKEALAVPGMQTELIIGMDVISRGVTTITPDGSGGVNFCFEMKE